LTHDEIKQLEQDLIGSLLRKPDNYFYAADALTVNDFVTPYGRDAWQAIGEGIKKGREINPYSVSLEIGKDSFPWLMVAESRPIVGSVSQVMVDKFAIEAQRRRVKRELTGMAQQIDNDDPELILLETRNLFQREITRNLDGGQISGVVDRFKQTRQQNIRNGRYGIETGLGNLDKHWITYQPGHIWVIGGWTSSGKTAISVELVARLLGQASVAFFSTEMTEEQVLGRLVANLTGINYHKVMAVGGAEIDRKIEDTCQHIAINPLRIFDTIRDVDKVGNQCRKVKMESGLDVVFIDFIQNLTKKGAGGKYEMAADIALDLQALAKELRCHIVALSQIPNDEGKQDSGLLVYKGAGEIAAAADVGMLIKRAKNPDNMLELQIRKNRHGMLTKFYMEFQNNWTRLEETT